MPGRIRGHIREIKERRSEWKFEKERIQKLGAERMRTLLNRYAPQLSKQEKQRLVEKFGKRISVYKGFAGFLAAHPTATGVVASGAVIGGASVANALAATAPASIAATLAGETAAFLATSLAICARAHTTTLGSVAGGRVTIKARDNNLEDILGLMDHEGTHWLMGRMAPKTRSRAVMEGVANYIELLLNAQNYPPALPKALLESGIEEGRLKGHSIRGLWYRHKELTRKDRMLNKFNRGLSHFYGGAYIHGLGEELSERVGKDAHPIMAKNLLQGKTLEEAVREVGREHGTSKDTIEQFIQKHKPPIS